MNIKKTIAHAPPPVLSGSRRKGGTLEFNTINIIKEHKSESLSN